MKSPGFTRSFALAQLFGFEFHAIVDLVEEDFRFDVNTAYEVHRCFRESYSRCGLGTLVPGNDCHVVAVDDNRKNEAECL